MKNTRTAPEHGQAGLALIIVIVWALTAVIMLTRTLVSAEQIDRKVNVITGGLDEVERETEIVAELQKTEKTSAAILKAAEPLTGMLKVVDETAKSIDETAKRIDPNAKSINQTVVSINGHVASILSTARSIENTLRAITGQAVDIRRTVDSIKNDTKNIQDHTNGSNGIRAHTCAIPLSGCKGPAPS